MKTPLSLGLSMLLTAGSWVAPSFAAADVRISVQLGGNGRPQAAYSSGYRQGQIAGEHDGRTGARFDLERHTAYRRAEYGGYGSRGRDAIDDAFRRGFSEGYRHAYGRFSWQPRVGGGRDARPNGAFDRGYRDGYDGGRQAARDRDRYDPRGERDYRRADGGDERGRGSMDIYRQNYRDGFLSGYERGFRDGQSRSDGWSR